MKLSVVAGLAAFAFAADSAAQTPPAASHAPVWQATPDGDDLAKVYPPEALAKGVSGTARVQCAFNDQGRLESCTVVSEDPAGSGFGAAAVALAAKFQASPQATDGRPIAGARVTIPIRFNAPPPEPPAQIIGVTMLVDAKGRQPTSDFLRQFYLERAIADGKSGKVLAECIVGEQGAFAGCKVLSQQPTDYAFGAATLRLLQVLKVGAGFQSGTVVQIPVTFSIRGREGEFSVRVGPDGAE